MTPISVYHLMANTLCLQVSALVVLGEEIFIWLTSVPSIG